MDPNNIHSVFEDSITGIPELPSTRDANESYRVSSHLSDQLKNESAAAVAAEAHQSFVDHFDAPPARIRHTKSSFRAASAPIRRQQHEIVISNEAVPPASANPKLPPPAPGMEHRRYTSVYPCANQLLAKRWDDAARERHRLKLATMKTYIDNAPPKRHGHLQLRLKKLQLEEENHERIERENLILLDRMTRQLSAPEGFSGLDNTYKLKKGAQRPTPSARKKKEEKQQIAQENQVLMQRVEAREPHYSQEHWDEERRTNLSYLQRISRFPEGYQHILEREGVPPPVKQPLKVRMNRSELLRRKWTEENVETGENQEFGYRSASPYSSDYDSGDEAKQSKEVYLTKAEILRRAHIRKLQDQKERQQQLQEKIEAENRERSRSPSSRRIKVRMNRAQRLRLEEQEARAAQPDIVKPPIHLGNIEAKVDFGQDGWQNESIKAEKAAEKDWETQISNPNVEDSDFEQSLDIHKKHETSQKPTQSEVYSGLCLKEKYDLHDVTPLVNICWVSSFKDSSLERFVLLTAIIPSIREYAAAHNVQIILRDFKWGIPRTLYDGRLYEMIADRATSFYFQDSVKYNVCVLLGANPGHKGILPSKMSQWLYEYLEQSLTDASSLQLLKKWYSYDGMAVPPEYVLRPISDHIPTFKNPPDLGSLQDTVRVWRAEIQELISTTQKVIEHLKTTQTIENASEHDLELLNKIMAFELAHDVSATITGPTDDAIVIKRKLVDIDLNDAVVTDFVPFNDGKVDQEAEQALGILLSTVDTYVTESRQLQLEVKYSKNGVDVNSPETRTYVQKFGQDLYTQLQSTVSKFHENTTVDELQSEILFHNRLLREKAASFIGRSRLLNKIISFMGHKHRFGVPPFIVQGHSGIGKSTLLSKAIMKFVNDIQVSTEYPERQPVVIVRFVGATADSATNAGMLFSLCRQLRHLITHIDESGANYEQNHFVDSYGPAYDCNFIPNDYGSLVSSFRQLLQTVSSKRQVILALFGLEKLNKEKEAFSYAWLPIEHQPPNVNTIVTISDEDDAFLKGFKERVETATANLTAHGHKLFGEHHVTVEGFDIVSCHVVISKWCTDERIILSDSIRKTIIAAVAPQHSHPNNQASPQLLRYLYLEAKASRWSENFIADSGLDQIYAKIYDMLELNYGRHIVRRLSQLLLAMRDGASETEIDDLMSISADVLVESRAHQQDSAVIFGAKGSYYIPKVSSVVLVGLLTDLVETYKLVTHSKPARSPSLLYGYSCDKIRNYAAKRYANDWKELHTLWVDIGDYFGNVFFHVQMDNADREVDLSRCKLLSSTPERPKVTNLLPKNEPLLITDDQKIRPNTRRAREYCRALVMSQRWKEVHKVFENFLEIESLVKAMGLPNTVAELNWIVHSGRKALSPLPQDIYQYLTHLILFFRHRLPWISQIENSDEMCPNGVWLQEFRNFPTPSSAIFAEPVQGYLENHWDDLMPPRAGRLEYEKGWNPDTDLYGPVPFMHNQVQCCAVSSDGKILATGAENGLIKLWDIGTGEELQTFTHCMQVQTSEDDGSEETGISWSGITAVGFSSEKPPSYVLSAAHNPDGDSSIILWPLKPSAMKKKMVGGHTKGSIIKECEFLQPENRRVVSIGTDFNVVLWEVARSKLIRVIKISMIVMDIEPLGDILKPTHKREASVMNSSDKPISG